MKCVMQRAAGVTPLRLHVLFSKSNLSGWMANLGFRMQAVCYYNQVKLIKITTIYSLDMLYMINSLYTKHTFPIDTAMREEITTQNIKENQKVLAITLWR